MENNILSKEEVLKLVYIYKDRFTQYFKRIPSYKPTIDFILAGAENPSPLGDGMNATH